MKKHDYREIMDAAGRQAAMAACWADIRQVFRDHWDCFAIYDFYCRLILDYGSSWKCVRWTSNNDIMCCIVEVSQYGKTLDITFFAKYDETQPMGYKSAKHVTIRRNAI